MAWSAPDRVDQLIDTIYESGLSGASWTPVLESIAKVLGAPVATSFWFQKSQDRLSLARGDIHNVNPEHLVEYAAEIAAVDPRARFAASKKAGSLVTDIDIARDFSTRYPAIQDAAKRFSMEGWLCLVVANNADWLIGQSFYFGDENRPHDEMRRKFLYRLYGHLNRAMRLATQLAGTQALYRSFEDIFDRLTFGALILDSDARVLHLNPVAEGLLVRENGVVYALGTIHAVDANSNKRLANAISRALLEPNTLEREEFSVLIESPSTGECLLLSIVPLAPSVADRVLGGWTVPVPRLLVTVGNGNIPDNASRIKAMYRLTSMETDVAMCIARGSAIDEIARARAVSTSTIRTHLKSVYGKVGVRSQSQLAHKVLATSLEIVR